MKEDEIMVLTPGEIAALARYYYDPVYHCTMEDTEEALIHLGLVGDSGITERGETHIKTLLTVPLPVQRWISE